MVLLTSIWSIREKKVDRKHETKKRAELLNWLWFGCYCLNKLIMTANISSNFQTNLSLLVEQFGPPAAIWHPPKKYPGPERWMNPGCSDRGQWFPFPCQLRGKHQDTDGCFMAMSGRMSPAAELRSLSALLPLPFLAAVSPSFTSPTPPRTLSSYLHYAFFVYAWAQPWLLLIVWGQAWLGMGYSK